MRIAMIGGGYVGLVSAACFADLGTEVAIVETDPERLHMLREGRMPIYEPGLERRVADCQDALDAAGGADALIVVTEWNEFRALSPARLCQAMRGRMVVDLRNVFDPSAMRRAGLAYQGVGRTGNVAA